MIKKVELVNGYSVIVENDSKKQKTQLGVEKNTLLFTSKQDVARSYKPVKESP